MKFQITKWQQPLFALASSCILATLFFSWALSTPPYEKLHSLIGGESYYTSEAISETPNFEINISALSPKHQTTLYLAKIPTTLNGPEKLKYIRLAIQASPEDVRSYDSLVNLVKNVPTNFNIAEYLSTLYAYPNAKQKTIAEIAHHRFKMFDNPERQQQFINGLSNELREALINLKPKNLQELKTQIRRNE